MLSSVYEYTVRHTHKHTRSAWFGDSVSRKWKCVPTRSSTQSSDSTLRFPPQPGLRKTTQGPFRLEAVLRCSLYIHREQQLFRRYSRLAFSTFASSNPSLAAFPMRKVGLEHPNQRRGVTVRRASASANPKRAWCRRKCHAVHAVIGWSICGPTSCNREDQSAGQLLHSRQT